MESVGSLPLWPVMENMWTARLLPRSLIPSQLRKLEDSAHWFRPFLVVWDRRKLLLLPNSSQDLYSTAATGLLSPCPKVNILATIISAQTPTEPKPQKPLNSREVNRLALFVYVKSCSSSRILYSYLYKESLKVNVLTFTIQILHISLHTII